jgi:antitoxin (DNA-binding transcriptional repressor) of toxin-antitoxin stability system
MKQVSVREVRSVLTHLDEVLAEVGELVITRHGRPIARVLPPGGDAPMPSHADFRKTMPRLTVGSEFHVRADRDGR